MMGIQRSLQLSIGNNDLQLHLRHKVDGILCTAICLFVALLRPNPRTSVMVIPCTFWSDSAFFTSSSLKWRIMASIFFIGIDSLVSNRHQLRDTRALVFVMNYLRISVSSRLQSCEPGMPNSLSIPQRTATILLRASMRHPGNPLRHSQNGPAQTEGHRPGLRS